MDMSLFRLTWMIYVYIIRIMQGAAGANRPTGSMSKVALEPTIAISAIAAGLAPEEFRCQAQHGDSGLRDTRSDHECADQLRLQEEEGE